MSDSVVHDCQIAEVQWPGNGEIKRPEVNMRAKRLLSIWKEVKDI